MLTLNGFSMLRWEHLLSRGHRDELASYCVENTTLPNGTTVHRYNIESSSSNRFHTVELRQLPTGKVEGACTCPAHRTHSLCKHIALAVEQTGLLNQKAAA